MAFILIALSSLACVAHGAKPQAQPSIESHGLGVRTQGVGADAHADVIAVIEMQTAMTEDTSMTPPLADDIAFFVRQRYLELGYPEAKVRWEIDSQGALLHVTEGTHYTVGAITYEGNSSQNAADLTQYLLRPTHEKLGKSGRLVPFVEADLRAGSQQVERFIRGQGYLNATVTELVFTAHQETGKQDVLVRLKEGGRYQIGQISVTGDLVGREKEVQKQLKALRDQPFNEVKIETTRAAITGIYQGKGYFEAEVTAHADATGRPDGIVPVTFHVVPGSLFRVSDIVLASDFSGGAQRLIKSGFKPAVGKVYSPAELEVMHRRMLDTEVFSRLDVTPKPAADGSMTIELSGEEAMRKRLSAYAGYETFLGAIVGAEYREVNYWDTGNAIRIKAEYTGKGFNGAIQEIDPALFGSPYAFDAELAMVNNAVFDYERRTVSLRTTLSRHWNKHIYASLFGEGSINKTSSDTLSPAELGPDDYRLATVGTSLILDYRNSPVLPTDGWTAGLTIADAFAAGTDVGFLRGDLYFSFYQPITKKLRAAFSARTSVIRSDNGVEGVPIDLRVFNGGATSVRSFAEREMGAKSRSGTPLGGTLSNVFSAELSYEIRPNLELALFGDAGSLSPTETNPFRAPSGLRYAVGVGFRYKLPFGPLRVDYGFNPTRKGEEKAGALHVTFGFAF